MSLPTTGVLFSGSTPAAAPGNQLCEPQTDGGTPAQIVSFVPRLATADKAGVVRPDGTTLAVDVNGVMSVIAAGTGPGGGGTSASGGLYVCVSPTQDPADGTRTQFILPAPQLAGTIGWLVRNDTMQRQLGSKAQFSVQGTQLTLKYPLEADADSYLEYYYIQGTPNSQSGGGGSVTPTPLALRGSSFVSGTASTLTVTLPTGAQAGDLAILFSDPQQTPPSGWTLINTTGGDIYPGFACSKLLTSTDISTGTVTVGTAGYDAFVGMVCFVGPTNGIRESVAASVGGGITSPPAPGTFGCTTSAAVLSTDIAIYWDGDRNNVGPGTVPTITPLSGSPTILQSGSSANAGAVLASQAMPGGVFKVNFTRTHEAFGSVVIVKA
jgi:hypothetical protein